MTPVALAPLDYYAAARAALFPIPAGSKAPTGIVASFAHDHSSDPAQWARWYAEHKCNFGLVAGPSRLIVADIDVKKVGRDAAWAAWCETCKAWGLDAPLMPQIQTPSQGWHVLFSVPDDVDAAALRQPGAANCIDIRAGNGYVVAAGSAIPDGHYILLTDAPPYPAPAALIEHCTRTAARTSTTRPGERDRDDVAALLRWLAEKGAFADYDSWCQAGMALKLEFGDDGLALWDICHDGTPTDDVIDTKWASFASEPAPGAVTLASWLDRANKMGWRGTVRRSSAAMFGDAVAQIASSAGASLSSAPTGVPLADTQKIVDALGAPIVDNFLAGTNDVPTRPMCRDYPTLPEATAGRALHDDMCRAIDRVVAMAEDAKTFRQKRVEKVLAVLYHFHQMTYEALVERVAAFGAPISPASLDSAVKNFEWTVRTEMNTQRGFITDARGQPAGENSDNVHVFVRERGIELRYNVWTDQAEVSDIGADRFISLDENVFNDLLMDAENSFFNYHPSEGRFRRGLLSNARRTLYDPVVERLASLKWDGTPRLSSWLTMACGTPCDVYHQSVGRNLFGGMVRRARHPGCVQAETVIFISPTQGTGKSTLTKILALDPAWHTDSFKFDGTPQNCIPQLFGKWVVELSELAGLARKDAEHIKAFMSSTTDNFTPKYAAFARDIPRRCVFIGTSNDKRPLLDATGNRRFLPVHVIGEVNTDWLTANVEQLFAETCEREAAGEDFSIPREVWEEAGRHQEAARTMSPVEELCQEWFDRPEKEIYILATDIGRALKMTGQSQYARYQSFLDKLGWRNENVIAPATGRRSRVWMRGATTKLHGSVRLVPVQAVPNGPVEMRLVAAQ